MESINLNNLTELQMLYAAIALVIIINIFAMILFLLYAALPNSGLKKALHKIIYELDRAADNMSNKEKRNTAINVIRDTLGWKRILIPTSLIGVIIDAEVAAIRYMQELTNTPDLHKEEEKGA
jgi:hypothetical protein